MSSSRLEGSATQAAASPLSGCRVVSGRLDLGFAADADGRTYLRHQYAGYPFHVCRVQFQDPALPDLATLYIQSSSGGVYEDDQLALAISAGEAAQVHLTTQAATIVHSMPRGRAEQRARVECERGSYVEYLPDPQVLFPGSTFVSRLAVRMHENATALVSDCFLQHDPEGRGNRSVNYLSEIVVEDASGQALAIDRLHIDGSILGRNLPGVTGCFAAQGSFVVARRSESNDLLLAGLRNIDVDYAEAFLGATQLPNSAGVLVRLLAADGAALRRVMHLVWCSVRCALSGHPPVERRK